MCPWPSFLKMTDIVLAGDPRNDLGCGLSDVGVTRSLISCFCETLQPGRLVQAIPLGFQPDFKEKGAERGGRGRAGKTGEGGNTIVFHRTE